MKTKIKSIIVAIVVVIAGYVISNPLFFHICGNTYEFNSYTGCLDSSIKNIGSPLLIFSLWLLLCVVTTTLFSEKIFHSWLKFAVWAIPLCFILIAVTPVTSNSIIDFFPFYRDDAARLAGGIFAAVSLIIIIWKWIVVRRHEQHI